MRAGDRLPGMFQNASFVEEDGLRPVMSTSLLHGAAPASLAVGTPNQDDFAVNLKTAAALGLAIPPDVAAQATETIQ